MKRRLKSILAREWRSAITGFVFFAAAIAPPPVRGQPASGFLQSQSIYQIFTDRFFDGDASNNNASGSYNASSGGGVHGGDFKGIEQKLDYIKALGATAIWISPIILNGYGEYHGYAGRDFCKVDPHWGTLANLQSLVNAAHAKGLLVIQDVVVNHGAGLIGSSSPGYPTFNAGASYVLSYYSSSRQYAAPFNTNAAFPTLNSLFHNYGEIQDYGNTTQVEQGELSGLDDFRTELPYLRTNMAAVFNYWIQTAGFDGFRVDTVKHVEMGFWQDWCPRVHAFAATNGKPDFFMFGEVYDGSDAKCGSYTGTQGGGPFKLDSTLDFPLYFTASGVFAKATGNTKQIEDHYNAITANYDLAAQNQLVTFLDNHDLPRFLNSANANGNTNRLAVALAFLYTARGTPCLYQGTEQAFNGGADPNNREDMFDGAFEQGPSLGDNFNMTHPLFQLVAKLNNFRRLYPALRTGTHANLWNDPNGPGLFAYARRLGTQEVFVVFNTAGSTQTLPSRPTSYPPGTVLVNLFNPSETITIIAGPGTPALDVPATTAKIFVAQAQLLPLDPVVVSVSPTHDAANVSALAPLVLQFSVPMETNSVLAAFSTTPTVSGSYAWSATRDMLTFVPSTNWPVSTLMTAQLGDTAQADDITNRLFAAFESRFRISSATDVSRPTVTIQTPMNGSTVVGNLTVSGTASDNVAVAKVEVQLDDREWLPASGTTTWSWSLDTSNFLNGPHALSVRATDSTGNSSLTNSVEVLFFNTPGAYLRRIGGGTTSAVTDCSGNVWSGDQAYSLGGFGFVGGTMGSVANTVIGICPEMQPLYQRERFSTSGDGFRYLFDCPAGVYETTLLEAETWWDAVGQRVFDVFIEGQPVLTDFDIFAAAGGKNLPLARVFTNNIADSQLEILFTPIVDNARISGIQVRKVADLYSDNDGIPDWWRLGYFGHALGQVSDQSHGEDDADNDGAPNLSEYLTGTNPWNAVSAFKIVRVGVTNDVDLVVSCVAGSNRTCQLQRCRSLDATSLWVDVGSPQVASEVNVVFFDPGGISNSTSFYRVRTW